MHTSIRGLRSSFMDVVRISLAIFCVSGLPHVCVFVSGFRRRRMFAIAGGHRRPLALYWHNVTSAHGYAARPTVSGISDYTDCSSISALVDVMASLISL